MQNTSNSVERQQMPQEHKSSLWKGGTHEEFRRRIVEEKERKTYDLLERRYSINRYYLFRVIHEKEYILPVEQRKKAKVTLEHPRNRRAINLDDPKSANVTIRNAIANLEYRQKLAEYLLCKHKRVMGTEELCTCLDCGYQW